MSSKIKILLVVVIFSLLFSCGKKTDTRGIEFNLNVLPKIVSYDNAEILTLTDNLYAKLNFEYKMTEKFKKLAGNYTVFVHFWRKKQDKMLLNFDHTLKSVGIPDTSKWKIGDVFKYSKNIYIPKFLDDYDAEFDGFENINLTVGLYNEKDKIILLKKEIRVEAEDNHAPAINYQEGWNDLETDLKAKAGQKSWRWTTKKATCIIDNQNFEVQSPKNFTLIIRGGVSKNILKDQSVIFKINGKELDKFIPENDTFDKKYIITPSQMGKEYVFSLTIETDMSFIPSKLDPNSKDNRELGLRIFYIYFREAVQ